MKRKNDSKLFILNAALVAGLLFLWPKGGAHAAEYYVDPNGIGLDGIAGTADDVVSSDSNNGSGIQPWKSITKAQTSVAGGDTIHLRSANYGKVTFGSSVSSGQDGNWISYAGNPGAIFSALVFYPGAAAKDYYIKIRGVHLKADYVAGTACSGFNTCGAMVDFNKLSRHIRLESMEVEGFVADDGFPASIYGFRFWGGDTSDIVLERNDIHALNDTILGWSVGANSGTGNKILYNHIHDVMGSAISTFTGLDLIEGNVIHDEIPQVYNTSHVGGSGMAIRKGDLSVKNNIVYNYGMTRPIRWYQSVAGDNGYQNVLLENNLVYFTKSGANGFAYNGYVEIIDAGANFKIKNNTFSGGLVAFLAVNNDGSGLELYNNVLSSMRLNDHYDTSANLASQTCDAANRKWAAVQEGGNIFGSLTAAGGGYLCKYPYFSSQSTSAVDANYTQLFKNAAGFDYRLADTSRAINFGVTAKQPSDSLADLDASGFLRSNGIARDAMHHSAGAYEYKAGITGTTANRADVNNSSTITSADALLTMRYSLGLPMAGTGWQASATAGDVNCDGRVAASDALLILRYSLGLSMSGTAWCGGL